MKVDNLHKRLDALSERITDMETRLKERASWHDGHRLTGGELDARYRYLKSELEGELKDVEAQRPPRVQSGGIGPRMDRQS